MPRARGMLAFARAIDLLQSFSLSCCALVLGLISAAPVSPAVAQSNALSSVAHQVTAGTLNVRHLASERQGSRVSRRSSASLGTWSASEHGNTGLANLRSVEVSCSFSVRDVIDAGSADGRFVPAQCALPQPRGPPQFGAS
jgi:hypothetical protein